MATVTTLNAVVAQSKLARVSETTLRLQRALKSLERVNDCQECGDLILAVLVRLNASIKADKGLVARPIQTVVHKYACNGVPVERITGMAAGYCFQDKLGRRFHMDEVKEVS